MTNVQEEVKEGKLILTIDLSKSFGRSKSGKTITVATTGGFVPVTGTNIAYSLNVNKKE